MKLHSDLAIALVLSLLAAILAQQVHLPDGFVPVAIAQTAFLYIAMRFTLSLPLALSLSLLSLIVLPVLPAASSFSSHFAWQYPIFLLGLVLALVPVEPGEGKNRSFFAGQLLGLASMLQPALLAPALGLTSAMIAGRQHIGLGGLPGFALGMVIAGCGLWLFESPFPKPAFAPEQIGIHLFSPNRGILLHAAWIIPTLIVIIRKSDQTGEQPTRSAAAFLLTAIFTPIVLAVSLADPQTWRVYGAPFGLGLTLLAFLAMADILPLVRHKRSLLVAIVPFMAVSAWLNLATSLRPETTTWLDRPIIEDWPERLWSFADIQAFAPSALATHGRFDRHYKALLAQSSLLPSWRKAAPDNARELDLIARNIWDQGDWDTLHTYLSQLESSTVFPAARSMLPDLFQIAPLALLTDYTQARRNALFALAARKDARCHSWANGQLFSVMDALPETEAKQLHRAESALFAHDTAISLVPLHTGRPFAPHQAPLQNGAPIVGTEIEKRIAFSRTWLKARSDNAFRRELRPQKQVKTDRQKLVWCLQRALFLDLAIDLPETDMRDAISYMLRQSIPATKAGHQTK